jgi:ABC-2 type transport system ATP-binding protein
MTEPVVRAEGLGLRTRRGWVFHDLDLELAAGTSTALVGPAGSGRSMALLTLAGRAKPTHGTLTVAGASRRGAIRGHAAIARVTGAVELEPDLRVADHRAERRLLGRADRGADRGADRRAERGADRGAERDLAELAALVGCTADGADLVGDLPADQAALLALALAATGGAELIVLDDVDAGADPAQQRRIWQGLAALAAAGHTVLASTGDPDHVEGAQRHELTRAADTGSDPESDQAARRHELTRTAEGPGRRERAEAGSAGDQDHVEGAERFAPPGAGEAE